MNDVTICIPVYNKFNLTKLCLEQLFSTKQFNRGFNLIICDDGSTEEHFNEYLRKLECNLLVHETNQGFVKSVNDMLKEVKTKYFVLMNNDVLVHENWLDKLLEPLDKNEQVGISSLYGRWDEKDNMISATFECAAIRTVILEKITHLDVVYGTGYYDDEDFCLNAKILGWQIDYPRLTKLLIEHFGGQTFGKAREELLRKNVKIFIKKWYPLFQTSAIVKQHMLNLFNPFNNKPGFSEEEIQEIAEQG